MSEMITNTIGADAIQKGMFIDGKEVKYARPGWKSTKVYIYVTFMDRTNTRISRNRRVSVQIPK